MKTLKRISAIALVIFVLFAMSVPFAAAAPYSIDINGKAGFTATVYKIADFDVETGAFSSPASTAVDTAIKNSDEAALLTAAEALTAAQLSGKVVATQAFTAAELKTVAINNAGVYYVKWTALPGGVTKAQNSVFALPYYSNGSYVNTVTIADTKTATDTPDATKTFTTADATEKFAKAGEVINFTLTGSVPGSAALPAQEIKFVDTMTQGLEFSGNLKVYGVKDSTDTELTSGYTVTGNTAASKSFTITFSATQTPALYTAGYKTIKITYDAKLTGSAIDYTTSGNINKLTYTYKNNAGVESDPIEKTRKVITFKFEVKKVDVDGNIINNNDSSKNAGFTLYTNQAATTAYTNEKITGEIKTVSGIAKFDGLVPGDYYVKETTAPDGYNLNSKVFKVTVNNDGTVSGTGVTGIQLTVTDTKVIVPNTGGEGTLIFTIVGIALIACAAVLFIIYKKKNASAK